VVSQQGSQQQSRFRRDFLPRASAWLSNTTTAHIKATIPTAARITNLRFISILQSFLKHGSLLEAEVASPPSDSCLKCPLSHSDGPCGQLSLLII
jgi:hypothetical protein